MAARSAEKLDGYSLTEKLRKARRRHNLSAPTQALYYELVAICNEENWVDEFKCSNNELCTALCISEKSLWGYRNELIQAGLISYRSGKSKKTIGEYSFNGCKIYNQSDNQSGNQSDNQSDNQSGNQKGRNTTDNIKGKTKRETKPNESSKSHSAGKPSDKEKTELPYWKKFIEAWHQWYEQKLGSKYNYLDKDFAHLKKIYVFLEKRAQEKKFEFNEENLLKAFKFFLNKAWEKDDWLRNNFTIPNILSQFNQIANGQSSNAKKQQTGASVSTGSILSKIAAMPD